MKDYIKPTFILAGLAPVAFAASCQVVLKGDFLENVYVSMDIPKEDYNNTFALTEGCSIGIPDNMVEYYCKFTSNAEATGGAALTS